jgi:hypothetical protein
MARSRFAATIAIAFVAQMSLIGFAPWYAGRKPGRFGAGLRSYGSAV